MQITSQNFESALQVFKEALKEADFVAFDTEFTGKPILT